MEHCAAPAQPQMPWGFGAREDMTVKIKIDVDCTPHEARTFLGLPDVAPMQKAMMTEVHKRMMDTVAAMEPEALFKTWLPAGIQGLEQMQKAFWSQMASGDKEQE
jgi:hypothetical protein